MPDQKNSVHAEKRKIKYRGVFNSCIFVLRGRMMRAVAIVFLWIAYHASGREVCPPGLYGLTTKASIFSKVSSRASPRSFKSGVGGALDVLCIWNIEPFSRSTWVDYQNEYSPKYSVEALVNGFFTVDWWPLVSVP